MNYIRTFICFIFSLWSICLSAEDYEIQKYLSDNSYYIFNNNIHTVNLSKYSDWSQPIIELNSSDVITCSFDDFDAIGKDYRYTFIHCDPSWRQSTGIIQSDYMTGYYTEEYIRDYSQSFNTLRDYTHYSFTFPNENINIGLSGNYALFVYEDDISSPAFIARFYVIDKKVSVPIKVDFSKNPAHISEYQRVSFSLECGSYLIREPYRSVTIVIQQNNKPYSEQIATEPKYITGSSYIYDFDDKFEFKGNNEFRNFDIRTLKYLTQYISQIDVRNSEYYVITHDISSWLGKAYQSFADNDGQYILSVRDGDVATEGEYAFVNLRVKSSFPMANEELYVCGEFNGWQFNEENKMSYNYETGEYQANLYLKQGYYNYCYVYKNAETQRIDEGFIDGSFVETQNRYSIMVYYQPTGERYCQLIGYGLINSTI